MKKKSLAIVVWLVSAVIALAVGVVALSQECNHDYGQGVVTVEATCFREGEMSFECSRCREKKTETLEKLPHSMSSWSTTRKATCTQSGMETRKCMNEGCSQSESRSVNALGHDRREIVSDRVEPTCTATGIRVLVCSRCDNVQTETIPAVGHQFTAWEEPNLTATCKTASHNGYHKCKSCGEPDPSEYAQSIIQPAHLSPDGWVVVFEPTCTTQGYETQSCQVEGCPNFGTVYDNNIPMSAHNYVSVEAKSATCMEAGYSKHEKCDYCGDTKGLVTIQQLSHKFNDDGYCTLQYGCGTYTYIFSLNADGKGYTLTGINKNSVSENRTVFNIPAVYKDSEEGEELPVTAIGDRVFNDSSFAYVKEITISTNVTSIGKSAFKNCVSLEEVTVRADEGATVAVSNVTTVGDYAFEDCKKLNTFDFSSLVSIGEMAFSGAAFEEIVLTSKTTNIGEAAFASNGKLAQITVPYVGLTKNDGNVFGVIFGTTNYDVPESLNTVNVLYAEELVKDAFKTVRDLTKVVLPDTCVKFGDSAFEGCTALSAIYVGKEEPASLNNFAACSVMGSNMLMGTQLTSLVLPFLGDGDKITNLGYLYGGENKNVSRALTAVELPKVTELASDAFAGCSFITTVSVENLKTISAWAFNGCSSLKNVVTDGSISKTGVFLGEKVTAIGLGAFAGCSSIETLTVPFMGGSVEATENRNLGYFFGSTSNSQLNGIDELALKSVIVLQNNDDECLDESAFACFELLETVKIPAVKEIGDRAFEGCVALEEIYYGNNSTANDFVKLPTEDEVKVATLEKIGFAAFAGCFKKNTTAFAMVLPFVGATSADGDGEDSAENPYTFAYIFGNIDDVPVRLNKVEIISEATPFEVSPYAFSGCQYLTEIVLPETLTEIGKYAFNNCRNLNDVGFVSGSEDLEKICEGAFRNCSSFTELVVPDNVKYIEIAAFEGCQSLESVTLPFIGRSIGYELDEGGNKIMDEASQRAFGYIFSTSASTSLQGSFVPVSLRNVTITKAETVVGQAFNGCSNIQYITLPATVEEIGSEAFNDCTNLKEVIFDGVEGENFDKWKVGTLGERAFYNCKKLEKVVLPASVKNIGQSAFEQCKKLYEIRTAGEEDNVLNVLQIGMCAFSVSFDEMRDVSLVLKNVQDIAFKAFEYVGAQSLTIMCDEEYEVPRIETYAFYYSKLVNVNLPDTLTEISNSMFEACSKLKDFRMPKSIQRIGGYAFSGCTSLTILATNEDFKDENVLFFDHAVEVGSYAFQDCRSLQEIVFNNYDEYETNEYTVTTIGKYAFKGCSGVTRIYLRAYDSQQGSSKYIEEGVGFIDEYAFSGCGSYLRYVNICIGANEFDGGWSEVCLQGANVQHQDYPYISGVTYEKYLAYREYCVSNGGYALWETYQEYVVSRYFSQF